MKTITQHALTSLQIVLVKRAVEFFATSEEHLTDVERVAVDDLQEAMNEKIFGGEQIVLIQYVEGIERTDLHCLRCGRPSLDARFCSLDCAHLGRLIT